jgi:hypothetical protein
MIHVIFFFGITYFFTLRKSAQFVIFCALFQQKNVKQKFKLYAKEINLLLSYIRAPFLKFLKFFLKTKKQKERGKRKGKKRKKRKRKKKKYKCISIEDLWFV